MLCEKPMALSAYEAEAMFHAARKAGTFLGEAFMYRLHPQTAKLVELVEPGASARSALIKSSFGFAMGNLDPAPPALRQRHAGGGILDVGCYPVSMARLIAGASPGKPFLDPVKVAGVAHLGATGVDEWAAAVLQFPNGIIAEVSCSVCWRRTTALRIFGTEGRIEVKDFWFARGQQGGDRRRSRSTARTGDRDRHRRGAGLALRLRGRCRRRRDPRRQRRSSLRPGMSWADTLGNLRVLDKWRAVGRPRIRHREARRREGDRSPAGRLQDADPDAADDARRASREPASVVALGGANLETFAQASILLDAFYEAGGNVFDTAWVYGMAADDRCSASGWRRAACATRSC